MIEGRRVMMTVGLGEEMTDVELVITSGDHGTPSRAYTQK